MNYDWLAPLISKPWQAYANGPDAFDCRGIVYAAYPHVIGCTPDLPMDTPPLDADAFESSVADCYKNGGWQRISTLQHGCLVLMAKGAKLRHMGMWLNVNGGRLLHCSKLKGVALEPATYLKNYHRVEYYLYVGTTNNL